MRQYKTDAAEIHTFLEAKSGAVRARVYGPRLGYRWFRIKMWRYEKHPTTGQWQESSVWRETDWPHVTRLARKIDKVVDELNARETTGANPHL